MHDISYASPRGGRVPGYLVVPAGPGPFAGIIFMHGAGGSRAGVLSQAIMYARTGAVSLAIDAPMSGGRAIPGEQFLDYRKPERTRDAFIQTVVDLRRGVDLLLSRPDVDPKRLAYVGGSFGAFVGGVLSGVEKRIRAYALRFGAGIHQRGHRRHGDKSPSKPCRSTNWKRASKSSTLSAPSTT